MTIIYAITSMIVIALIIHTVLTRNLPKRKLSKARTGYTETAQHEPSIAEIRLMQERAYYQRKLTNLSDDGVYEKRIYGTVYHADVAGRINDEKSAIEQCIRDINHELMQLKGKGK